MSPQGSGRKIIILCEGDTEEIAIRHFVARQWQAEGLGSTGLKPINLRGKPQEISQRAPLDLEESDVLAVFTLIDLHGMDRVTHAPSDQLDSKVKRVCEWLKNQVHSPRLCDFHPHLCVHQVEAWILAEGTALAGRLNDPTVKCDPSAEAKNFQRPPSRRIDELFHKKRGDRYRKVLDGQPIFKAMQFEPVYSTCHYFRTFFDDLRNVGRC